MNSSRTDAVDAGSDSWLAHGPPESQKGDWVAKIYYLKPDFGGGEWEDGGTGALSYVLHAKHSSDQVAGNPSTGDVAVSSVSLDQLLITATLYDAAAGKTEIRITAADTVRISNGTIVTVEGTSATREVGISFLTNIASVAFWQVVCSAFGVPSSSVTASSAAALDIHRAATVDAEADDVEFGVHAADDDGSDSSDSRHITSGGGDDVEFSHPPIDLVGDFGSSADEGMLQHDNHDTEDEDGAPLSQQLDDDILGAPHSPAGSSSDLQEALLPPPTFDLERLVDIETKLAAATKAGASSRESLVAWLERDQSAWLTAFFSPELSPFVGRTAGQGAYDQRAAVYGSIAHTLLRLNDTAILDALMRQDLFLPFVAAIAFDADDLPGTETLMRALLETIPCHKQVLPIKDPELLFKIHQNANLVFLRDVILPRNYDDSVLQHLGSTVFFNNADIINKVMNNPTMIRQLATILRSGHSAPSDDALAQAKKRMQATHGLAVDDDSDGGSEHGKGEDDMSVSTIGKEEDDDGAAMPVPSAKRCDALRFLSELVMMAKGKTAAQKSAFFRQLFDKLGPGSPYAVLEPVLGDRHAMVDEVTCAFELLRDFATFDLHSLRVYIAQKKNHPPAPPRRGSTTDAGSAAARSSTSIHTAVPSSHDSQSTGAGNSQKTSDSASSPLAASDAASLQQASASSSSSSSMSNQDPPPAVVEPIVADPIDDGHSIRLYEKLEALGLTVEGAPRPHGQHTREQLQQYNVTQRGMGEHGRLVDHPTSGTSSTLMHKIVWRAVDDPDSGIQGLACDTVRMVLEAEPGTLYGDAAMSIDVVLNTYLPWLLTPFTHPDLPEPINHRPGAAMTALKAMLAKYRPAQLHRSEHNSRPVISPPLPDDELRTRVVHELASGFDGTIGNESETSKSSKANIADVTGWCFGSLLLKMKMVANRWSLQTQLLRLLRYRGDKLLVALGIKIVRTLAGAKDAYLYTEMLSKNLLAPVAAALLLNGDRVNLIHSAACELFEHLRTTVEAKSVWTQTQPAYAPLLLWAHLPPAGVVLPTDNNRSGGAGGAGGTSGFRSAASLMGMHMSSPAGRVLHHPQPALSSEDNYFESEDDEEEAEGLEAIGQEKEEDDFVGPRLPASSNRASVSLPNRSGPTAAGSSVASASSSSPLGVGMKRAREAASDLASLGKQQLHPAKKASPAVTDEFEFDEDDDGNVQQPQVATRPAPSAAAGPGSREEAASPSAAADHAAKSSTATLSSVSLPSATPPPSSVAPAASWTSRTSTPPADAALASAGADEGWVDVVVDAGDDHIGGGNDENAAPGAAGAPLPPAGGTPFTSAGATSADVPAEAVDTAALSAESDVAPMVGGEQSGTASEPRPAAAALDDGDARMAVDAPPSSALSSTSQGKEDADATLEMNQDSPPPHVVELAGSHGGQASTSSSSSSSALISPPPSHAVASYVTASAALSSGSALGQQQYQQVKSGAPSTAPTQMTAGSTVAADGDGDDDGFVDRRTFSVSGDDADDDAFSVVARLQPRPGIPTVPPQAPASLPSVASGHGTAGVGPSLSRGLSSVLGRVNFKPLMGGIKLSMGSISRGASPASGSTTPPSTSPQL